MNIFTVLLRLWPAIKDTFFGGLNLSFYLKRNRAIAVTFLAMIVTLISMLYCYEQAFMHGAVSKALAKENAELRSQIKDQSK